MIFYDVHVKNTTILIRDFSVKRHLTLCSELEINSICSPLFNVLFTTSHNHVNVVR